MPKILSRCAYCKRIFGLTAGGYEVMRTTLLAHMMKCDERPQLVSQEQVVKDVDRIMAAVQNGD